MSDKEKIVREKLAPIFDDMWGKNAEYHLDNSIKELEEMLSVFYQAKKDIEELRQLNERIKTKYGFKDEQA